MYHSIYSLTYWSVFGYGQFKLDYTITKPVTRERLIQGNLYYWHTF